MFVEHHPNSPPPSSPQQATAAEAAGCTQDLQFPPGGPVGDTRGCRVLVVDDNRDAADSLALLLPLWGHAVRVAYDGPAALEAVRAYRPEVVLLDLGLPGMTGYEVAGRLRREPGLEKVVLVAVSGYGQEADRRRTRGAGFRDHLVKPVDPGDLRQLLAGLCPAAGTP
ncbi:MAG TPA: response regulator [Gemmataceae bacterium]|nr:response regulator [Gemmataceae bacterium]